LKNNKPHIGLYLAAKPEAGGIYQYALSLIEGLHALNERIEISCFVEDENWRSQIPKEISVIYSKPNKYKKALGRMIRKVSFKSRNKYAALFDQSVRLINKSDCDLIIYPSQDSLTYQTHIPALTAVHDLMHRYEPHFSEYQGNVFKERERHYSLICKKSAGILVDSLLGKKHVEESYGMESNSIHLLPFVPPLYLKNSQEVDIKSKYNLPDNFVFYPAQFWEHKNHSALVKTIKTLKEKQVDVHMVFIGSQKNNYEKVVNEIAEANLQNDISILGYIPQNEMYSFYKQAKAMVFASLAGPTNIPPIEAMLLGCPALVSDAYAMPEQVGNGALLIDASNPDDIADKLSWLLEEEGRRAELIDSGYRQIRKWDQDAFNQRLSEIIFYVLREIQ
jgi:glycosyltransferase involved in cell wall biosynthesis